jgi:hypothetical protein
MTHPYANGAGYIYAKTTEWFDTSYDDDAIWDASWNPVSDMLFLLEGAWRD